MASNPFSSIRLSSIRRSSGQLSPQPASSRPRLRALLSLLFAAAALLGPLRAEAHVMTSANVYTDISLSAAKEEIVLLTGMNIIVYSHDDTLFRPQEKLSRSELAAWAAVFSGRAAAGDAPEQAAQAALSAGLAQSLDGNATYEDVNLAFFGGALALDAAQGTEGGNGFGTTTTTDNETAYDTTSGTAPAAAAAAASNELTREQFALFMGEHLLEPLPGGTLPEQAGYLTGPAGVVGKVSEDKQGGYRIEIAGETYRLYEHPRVLSAAADPAQWKGLTLQRSWLKPDAMDAQELVLHLLDFGAESGAQEATASAAADVPAQAEASSDSSGVSLSWLVLGAAALLLLLALAARLRRRRT
ncbi:hypothetical protein [Cohnella fermenti]|uniref:Uncharacterized protein n=1 Tax=Cohnella fermenti TaxID=2565925 RepID=A0A4S4BM11_9BACL|nr:hypothetical protein [Cohnella fermenti]THF75760.1 hypothetical protein E6C55_21140 [Cohnella fermenti]